MDFNQIAEFIDLVKNPDKYAKVVKDLQDEQARLTAVIETVGKASELDKLRKQVEQRAAKLEAEYAKKQADLDKDASVKAAIAAEAQDRLNEATIKAQRAVTEAQQRVEAAESVAQDYKRREKAIRQQEEVLAKEKADLAVMARDYEEKLAKLRSVMG